jgi:hypothetical protein
MDGLSSTLDYDEHLFVPYRIENLYGTPYVVYYLEKTKHKKLHFLKEKNFISDNEHSYKGVINWNKCSYLLYEMTHVEREFLSSEDDPLYKVTPYEILYTRDVVGISIHPDCIEFFKSFPTLCNVGEHEVPVVAYLGVGVSEIKEQILLQSNNERIGVFGKGFYFDTYENALYNAYYKEDTEDSLIRLENKIQLNDRMIRSDEVEIKIRNHSFYYGKHLLGESNQCNPRVKYILYYYDEDVIYLKSMKPNHCIQETHLRKESGYVMRYILFLKKHSMTKTQESDSYASDSIYMVKNSDNFICLSYHFIKKK